MCLTLLNSFNHMKSFTMFIFSWLKFVKKRGTSIYLWGYMSCLLFCVFIAPFCFGTIWNDIFSTKLAELLGLTVSISLDDSTTAGGAWHFCVGRLLLLRSKSGLVAISTITASVKWLSDKRYCCVRINHQIGPLSRTEQKSLWPQAVFREILP